MVSNERIGEILADLNRYSGDDIWQDIILRLGEYDEDATDEIAPGDGTRFALTDGTVIEWCLGSGGPGRAVAARYDPGWRVA